jgi:two-component system chemotaxis sensor kinase CheA
VRFVLPFSVMMTSVLTVAVAEQFFGIPTDNVIESVRVARGDIFPVGVSQAFVRRDRTIPIIDLGEAIGGARRDRGSSEATLVVVAVADRYGAVEVDGLGERMDVMLKPMSGLLSGTTGIAGATLMGDGRVLLVLDLPGLLS